MNGHNGHGRETPPAEPGMTAQVQVRLVPNIKIQNAEDSVMLLLGTDLPEIGAQMTPTDARRLAQALMSHADELDKTSPRIIIPGDFRP
jgi:hypothetical protein